MIHPVVVGFHLFLMDRRQLPRCVYVGRINDLAGSRKVHAEVELPHLRSSRLAAVISHTAHPGCERVQVPTVSSHQNTEVIIYAG